MKAVQRELADLLNVCRDEIGKRHARRPLSHAYRAGLSIITNAQPHTARRFVFNIDLADFFPTFNFGRVRGFFLKDQDFSLNEKVATVLAQIACFENSLPQGSPCSPIIADMMAHVLDVRLVRLAKKTKIIYSRYADDLTFSTNQKIFPVNIALPDISDPGQWIVGEKLAKEIAGAGFVVNPLKTRMQFRGSRQMVTGLTVNTKVNVSQRYWRGLRSMCKALYNSGEYYLPLTKQEIANGAVPATTKSLEPLAGMLSHVYHIKSKSGHFPAGGGIKGAIYGQADHARFWFFRTFVVPRRPVILCEGATDNIYLRNAIKHLSANYPQMVTQTSTGYKFEVSLFSYENLIHRILGLTGGIGPILKLVHGYRASLKAYKYKPLSHPVILLVDNDTAIGGKVCGALKKHFGVSILHSSPEPFFHLAENLYIVKTPLVGGRAMTCIEDLFDPATLAIPLEGKIFHTEKKDFDPTKHVGKKPFAAKIVVPNAETISWNGFIPLLDRLCSAMSDYAAKRVP